MACVAEQIQAIPPIPRSVPLAVSRSAEACRTGARPPLGKESEFAYQNLRGVSAESLPLARGWRPKTEQEILEKRRLDAWQRGRLAYLQRNALYKHGVQNSFKGLVKCRSRAIPKPKDPTKSGSPGYVQAQAYDTEAGGFSVGFTWTVKCGNPFFCFRCAPIIAAKRRDELIANCKSLKEQGFFWLFITFTAPHDLSLDPEFQTKAFNEARRYLRSGTPWQKFKEKFGYFGCVRATEMTDDHPDVPENLKTGTHWHDHSIFFFNRKLTAEEIREVYAWLSKKWAQALEKKGLSDADKREAVLKYAIKVVKPRKIDSEDDGVADYVAKWAGLELAPAPAYKKGRRETARVSHWEILRLAFSGERPELQERAIKIMKALFHKSWIQWSKGVKGFYGDKSQGNPDCDEDLEEDEKELVKGCNSENILYEYCESSIEEHGINWFEINRWGQQRRLALAVEAAVSGELFGEKMGAREACINFSRVVTEGCDPFTGEDFKTQYARGDPG